MFAFHFGFSDTVLVVTSDGRVLIGTLVGYDQLQNLVLNDAHERVYVSDSTEEVQEVPLGLYVIRGDTLCLVGSYDKDKLASIPRANPLPMVQQQQI